MLFRKRSTEKDIELLNIKISMDMMRLFYIAATITI
jgi:hypothetical protein